MAWLAKFNHHVNMFQSSLLCVLCACVLYALRKPNLALAQQLCQQPSRPRSYRWRRLRRPGDQSPGRLVERTCRPVEQSTSRPVDQSLSTVDRWTSRPVDKFFINIIRNAFLKPPLHNYFQKPVSELDLFGIISESIVWSIVLGVCCC